MPPNFKLFVDNRPVHSVFLFRRNIDSRIIRRLVFCEWDATLFRRAYGNVVGSVPIPELNPNVHRIDQEGIAEKETISASMHYGQHSFWIRALPDVNLVILRDILQLHPNCDGVDFGNAKWVSVDGPDPTVAIEDLLSLPVPRLSILPAFYTSSGRSFPQGPTRLSLFFPMASKNKRSFGMTPAAITVLQQYLRTAPVHFFEISDLTLSRIEESMLLQTIPCMTHLRNLSVIDVTASENMCLRAVTLTGHIPWLSLRLRDYMTPKQARDFASALVARKHPLDMLHLERTSLADADLAMILRTARDHHTFRKYESIDDLGIESAQVLADIARKNDADGLQTCKNIYVVKTHYWSILYPALAYSTCFQIHSDEHLLYYHRPTGPFYSGWVTKIDDWRLLGHLNDFQTPRGTDVYRPGDEIKPPGSQSDCAIVHGKDVDGLNKFLCQLPATLHSLAVGRTDMSHGIPAAIFAKPLRRLALFNCDIGEESNPQTTARVIRRRTVL